MLTTYSQEQLLGNMFESSREIIANLLPSEVCANRVSASNILTTVRVLPKDAYYSLSNKLFGHSIPIRRRFVVESIDLYPVKLCRYDSDKLSYSEYVHITNGGDTPPPPDEIQYEWDMRILLYGNIKKLGGQGYLSIYLTSEQSDSLEGSAKTIVERMCSEFRQLILCK